MRLSRPLRWSIAALGAAIAAACGARSALLTDEVTTGGGGGGGAPIEDAGPDVTDAKDADDEPDVVTVDCAEAGVTYIYLITQENWLYSFNPADGSVTLRGTVDCPSGGFTPFSMGVDRQGTAYVVFGDGRLYKVSTLDASCEPTTFAPGQNGFFTFGMGFSTDQGGPSESLYVAEINFAGPSMGLARIDTQTLDMTYIGPFSQNPGNAIELTGTGDGRLFGYFIDAPGPGGHVVEIDKNTGDILSSTPLPAGASSSSLAFAFWGGDFYIFTSEGDGITDVARYRPSDGTVVGLPQLGATVVGAGVSTCAPQQ